MVPHADSSVAMAKRAPMLSRGYTRARDYLFDSDDDTPVPELPVRTISHPAQPGCISPPPPKRVTSTAAPMTKARRLGQHGEMFNHGASDETATPTGVPECAAQHIVSAPLGCINPQASKGVLEGHGANAASHSIRPPTHIDRVPPCRRWCSMAKCRNERESKDDMAVVGERCCRSPTDMQGGWQAPDGGKQAIATCH